MKCSQLPAATPCLNPRLPGAPEGGKGRLMPTPLCFRENRIKATYLRSWALLEKLPIVQPFPAFYGTLKGGRKTPTLLGPLESANLIHWITHSSISTAIYTCIYIYTWDQASSKGDNRERYNENCDKACTGLKLRQKSRWKFYAPNQIYENQYTRLKKKKLRGLSPQANYTDRTTAAVGEVVPTFAGRGCYVVRATDSHGR
jgi:hypothetical protein